MSGPRCGQRGQSTTETIIMMWFVSLLIFGFIHFGMLATTKYLVSFAAYGVSRAAMVGGNQFLAAQGGLQYLNWRVSGIPSLPIVSGPMSVPKSTRPGFVVGYMVPFGPPVKSNVGPGVLQIRGFAPEIPRVDPGEGGDNGG